MLVRQLSSIGRRERRLLRATGQTQLGGAPQEQPPASSGEERALASRPAGWLLSPALNCHWACGRPVDWRPARAKLGSAGHDSAQLSSAQLGPAAFMAHSRGRRQPLATLHRLRSSQGNKWHDAVHRRLSARQLEAHAFQPNGVRLAKRKQARDGGQQVAAPL